MPSTARGQAVVNDIKGWGMDEIGGCGASLNGVTVRQSTSLLAAAAHRTPSFY